MFVRTFRCYLLEYIIAVNEKWCIFFFFAVAYALQMCQGTNSGRMESTYDHKTGEHTGDSSATQAHWLTLDIHIVSVFPTATYFYFSYHPFCYSSYLCPRLLKKEMRNFNSYRPTILKRKTALPLSVFGC